MDKKDMTEEQQRERAKFKQLVLDVAAQAVGAVLQRALAELEHPKLFLESPAYSPLDVALAEDLGFTPGASSRLIANYREYLIESGVP